jgi:glutamine amidotransferase-like uncharacterized protein
MFRTSCFRIAAVFFLFTLSGSRGAAALTGADVALYNDVSAPSSYYGAWQNGVTAIKSMLTSLGYSYEMISYADLNNSPQDFSQLYKIILIPGGYAAKYNYWISKAGKARIRNFVAAGGGYFGICAGAFFAVDRTIWEGTEYDDDAGLNAYGELTGYDLDLYPGSGTGPMNGIADWNTVGYNMTAIDFDATTAALANYRAAPFSEDILYYGGPYFTADAGASVEVLGTYAYNGKPAMVAFSYGSGRVVLSGPHPEIEEDADRDGVTIAREASLADRGSDWPMTDALLLWLLKKPAFTSLWTRSDSGRGVLWQTNPRSGGLLTGASVYSASGVGAPWQASTYERVSTTEAYVIWTRSDNGRAVLWQIDPSLPAGAAQLKRAVSIYSTAGVGAGWLATGYAHVSANDAYVLWTNGASGRAVLWQIDPSLPTGPAQLKRVVSLYTTSGIGAQWQATSYARVSDTDAYVLWTRSDSGRAVLWQIDPSLPTGPAQLKRAVSIYSAAGIGAPWQATAYTHVSATEAYVLWTRSDTGVGKLWQIDPSLPVGPAQRKREMYLYSTAGIGGPWQATGLALGD